MCCVEPTVPGWWSSCESKLAEILFYTAWNSILKMLHLAISTSVLLSSLIGKSMKSLFHGACFLYIHLIFSPLYRSKLICTLHPAVFMNGRKRRADIRHKNSILSEMPEFIKTTLFPFQLPAILLLAFLSSSVPLRCSPIRYWGV